jgi:hypothetical protein
MSMPNTNWDNGAHDTERVGHGVRQRLSKRREGVVQIARVRVELEHLLGHCCAHLQAHSMAQSIGAALSLRRLYPQLRLKTHQTR